MFHGIQDTYPVLTPLPINGLFSLCADPHSQMECQSGRPSNPHNQKSCLLVQTSSSPSSLEANVSSFLCCSGWRPGCTLALLHISAHIVHAHVLTLASVPSILMLATYLRDFKEPSTHPFLPQQPLIVTVSRITCPSTLYIL